MKKISIDIETYSGADLSKCGVYRYAESADFRVLLFGYAIDEGAVAVIDVEHGEEIPAEVRAALSDEGVEKWAYNCQFERICLSRYLGKLLSPRGWHCTRVWASMLGLPRSLADVGTVLGLEKQKLTEGKELIRRFCVPGNAKKTDDVAAWDRFIEYNRRDVEAEMQIQYRLRGFPVPGFIWEEFWLDQDINDRGVAVDEELVRKAIELDSQNREELIRRMPDDIENPNSVQQVKAWLEENGFSMETLGRREVAEKIKDAPEDIHDMLEVRQQLAKSSVKKYQAIQSTVCKDGRIRGMFQFYGANRSGRFSSKFVQLQNLPQNHLKDLAGARAAVKKGEWPEGENDKKSDILSQLIRTAFVPCPGCRFLVADFSAIEARVIAWLAGEQWVLDAFERGEDIYCATASRMYHVPVQKHGMNAELRQKGKQATLSCGYQGGVGALKAMGAKMPENEMKEIVKAWREANPNIVRFWHEMENAALEAVRMRGKRLVGKIVIECRSGMLFLSLPSGRRLAYVRPRIGMNRFGREGISYEGMGQGRRWERLETFGGKLAENVTQATARDLLLNAMQTVSRKYNIVMHIHDEIVLEVPFRIGSAEEVCRDMAIAPAWADGLPLRADGYECEFYRKE